MAENLKDGSQLMTFADLVEFYRPETEEQRRHILQNVPDQTEKYSQTLLDVQNLADQPAKTRQIITDWACF